jgi:hypothetical protein
VCSQTWAYSEFTEMTKQKLSTIFPSDSWTGPHKLLCYVVFGLEMNLAHLQMGRVVNYFEAELRLSSQ